MFKKKDDTPTGAQSGPAAVPDEPQADPTPVPDEKPEAEDCFIIRSTEDGVIGLRIKNKKDFTTKRIPLTFNGNSCTVRKSHCDNYQVTPMQVRDAIKQWPGYGGLYLICAGPGIELTPEIRAFNKKSMMSAADRKVRMVSGTRTANRS